LKIENYKSQIDRTSGAGHRPIRHAWHSAIFNFQFSILAVAVFGSLFFSPAARGGVVENWDAVEPPVAHRPANFSGAIGSRFHIQTRAAPTELQAEDPLTLTVSITGNGQVQNILRPDLRRLPRFAGRFDIENLGDRYLPANNTREFTYRVRPRTAAVKEIPPLPFVFFKPNLLPPEKGYQTTYADPIALMVRPRAQVSAARVEGMASVVEMPDSVYALVEGDTVLRHDLPFALPAPGVLALLLIGPPALGGLWYMVWRRCCPDTLRQLQRRRSRAAQQALKALQRSRKLDGAALPQQAEAIIARYLRQRLDLLTLEPTPMEVARHLEQVGSSGALGQQLARFFADCAAARFAPGLMDKPNNWTTTAARLVLALEEESWPPQLS
jgi:hypothetical protein